MIEMILADLLKVAIIGALAWVISDTAKEFKNLKSNQNGRK